jgi:hypothetical protein
VPASLTRASTRQTPAIVLCVLTAAAFTLAGPAQAAPKAPEFTHSSQAEWLNSKPLDFVIVSVHTPELPEERSIANVRAAVSEQKITNPVMVDGDYSYWNAMKNQFWPAFYLIDKRGRIASTAIGEMHIAQARAAELEQAIEEQLAADAS